MKLSGITLFSLLIVLAPSLSSAQDATGRVVGTTSDQQAAVIPDVQITVTNTATHVTKRGLKRGLPH